jgi:myo-inositol-1(or 4)-monophosphatase
VTATPAGPADRGGPVDRADPVDGAGPADRADPATLLALAREAARQAGELLLAGRERDVSALATKSSPTDVVTEMDHAAERLIRTLLLTARPDDGLLGEEGSDIAGTSGVRWVVDPLDGTVNYLYGYPAWSVSIAAEAVDAGAAAPAAAQTVAGVVFAPVTGTTWTATLGGGAWRDGRRLRGSQTRSLGQSLVGTGFGYAAETRRGQAEVLTWVLPAVRDIRRSGSAAFDLCCAAEGLLDAYYERGLNRWDMAAGELIAREAGLLVGTLDGYPALPDVVVAAPPALFAALVALLGGGPSGGR